MSPLHFSAKARLYGHIFYHKCCARVSRSGLLLPSVKSKLLIVKYRAIENVLVTRYDGMRKYADVQSLKIEIFEDRAR